MFAAYSTQKQVKLLDRKLGILYFVCILLVLGYVVGMRVILERSYNSIEKSYGIIGARLNGTTHMQLGGSSVPHDVASLTHVQEGDAIFLPTRIVTTHEQRLGNCTSPDEPCSVDSDCPVDPPLAAGLCTQGHCQVHQWCNAGGATSQRADPFTGVSGSATEEVIDAASFASLRLVVISTIQFPTLGRSVLSTEDAERGAKRSWSLSQLLLRARLDASDAITNGAVLAVTLHWNCHNLFDEDACEPTLLATPLSRSQPYATSWAHYYRRGAAGGPQYRDLLQARGLRLLVTAEGTGERIDALQIVMQFFVALALFPIAAYLADGIMQNLFSERRHYREYKTELSPDFSDVRAKVEQLEKQSQSRQAKAMNYAV